MKLWSLLKPASLVLILMLLVVPLAIACGGDDDDAAPTSTPAGLRRGGVATFVPSPTPEATATTAAVPTATTEAMAKEEVPDAAPKFADPMALAAKFGETPKLGGTFLNPITESFPHFDAHQAAGAHIQAMTMIYNGLLTRNPYDFNEIMPDLAYAWDISADGKTWTFQLREGVMWHDGMPFSSEDVKWTFDRVLTKGKLNDNETEGSFWGALERRVIDSVDAPDPNTIVFNLKGSYALLQEIVSGGYWGIIPKHISEAHPVDALKDAYPIGTGPFKVTEYPSTTLWKYVKNPDYFKPGLPFLDAMESHSILDNQTRATSVLTGRVYWNQSRAYPNMKFNVAEKIAADEPGIIHQGLGTFFNYPFYVNGTRAPFDDVRVRQAFNDALPREQFMLGNLGRERGVVGTQVYPDSEWALSDAEREKLIGYGPDIDARRENSRRLLAEYEAEMGEIDWSEVPYACGAEFLSCDNAEIIQILMKEVGVELSLVPGEVIEVWLKQIEGDFFMATQSHIIDFLDPSSAFAYNLIPDPVFGFHRRFHPEVTSLFEKQLFMTDAVERKNIIHEMDKLAINDSAHMMLMWPLAENLIWDFVKGIKVGPEGFPSNGRWEYIWLDK